MDQSNLPNISNFIDPSAKAIGLLGAFLYIIGFILTNTYLSKFGFHDYNVVSPRFIFAGTLFFFTFIILWIGVGRKLLTIKDVFQEIADSNGTFFSDTCQILLHLSKMGTTFIMCLIITSAMFFRDDGTSTAIALLYLICWLPVISLTDVSSIFRKTPWLQIPELLLRSVLIIGFIFVLPSNSLLDYLLFRYLWIIFISYGLIQMLRNSETFEFRSFNSGPYFLFAISLGIWGFGADLYGFALQKYGGPINEQAELYLKNSIRISIGSVPSDILNGKLVYQTDKYSLIVASDLNIVLSNDEIRAIKLIKSETPNISNKMADLLQPFQSVISKLN